MKKHQLAAMVLSALSAGILIGCSKPAEEAQNTANEQEVDSATANPQDVKPLTGVQAVDASSATVESYLNQVAQTHIVPAYKDVAQQSQALNTLAKESCQADGTINSEKLAELRAQWLTLATAWANAEVVNFGPAMDSMNNLYINYYPDERGLVHQGVIDVIDANPKLTAEQLAAESAVVQGIPGLEEVLFANESLSAGQCQYVMSASAALTERLNKAASAWETSPETLLGIGGAENKIGINRWINSVLSLIETTKSNSLDQPLGITGNKKGHLPADAAGQSRAIISAKVSALNVALTDPALVAILAENNQEAVANEMSELLADSTRLLAEMPEDIAKASPEQQKALYEKLTTLTQVIKHQLMPVLGVQVGFNSTDGD